MHDGALYGHVGCCVLYYEYVLYMVMLDVLGLACTIATFLLASQMRLCSAGVAVLIRTSRAGRPVHSKASYRGSYNFASARCSIRTRATP